MARQRSQLAAWLRDGREAAAPDTTAPPSPPMRGQRASRR
jgi:hypothetical protein